MYYTSNVINNFKILMCFMYILKLCIAINITKKLEVFYFILFVWGRDKLVYVGRSLFLLVALTSITEPICSFFLCYRPWLDRRQTTHTHSSPLRRSHSRVWCYSEFYPATCLLTQVRRTLPLGGQINPTCSVTVSCWIIPLSGLAQRLATWLVWKG